MMLDRVDIQRLVPQRGAMCLLDAVVNWDPLHISCRAAVPRTAHPLVRDHRVPAIVAIEYAAQAAAVHGALLDPAAAPRDGMLAKLNEVHLHADQIPTDGALLDVRAERLGITERGCMYRFDVSSGNRPVASGRLIVAFGLPPSP